jgi:hypothetical protein
VQGLSQQPKLLAAGSTKVRHAAGPLRMASWVVAAEARQAALPSTGPVRARPSRRGGGGGRVGRSGGYLCRDGL